MLLANELNFVTVHHMKVITGYRLYAIPHMPFPRSTLLPQRPYSTSIPRLSSSSFSFPPSHPQLPSLGNPSSFQSFFPSYPPTQSHAPSSSSLPPAPHQPSSAPSPPPATAPSTVSSSCALHLSVLPLSSCAMQSSTRDSCRAFRASRQSACAPASVAFAHRLYIRRDGHGIFRRTAPRMPF